jgi:hypothetical protein
MAGLQLIAAPLDRLEDFRQVDLNPFALFGR